MQGYQETRFRTQLEGALKTVKQVLDKAKHPVVPETKDHVYDDKYALVEGLSESYLHHILSGLLQMGLSMEEAKKVKHWSESSSVSLAFVSTETCAFQEKKKRKIEADVQHETKTKIAGISFGSKSKTVKIVTEYFWEFKMSYELYIYKGANPSGKKKVSITKKESIGTLVTTTENAPKPESSTRAPITVDITYLFSHMDEEVKPGMKIDRSDSACHTPRRNEPVNDLLKGIVPLYSFGTTVCTYFDTLFRLFSDLALHTKGINVDNVFVGVVPVFVNGDCPILTPEDILLLKDESKESLQSNITRVQTDIPDSIGVISSNEVCLLMGLKYLMRSCECYHNGVD